MSADQSAHPNYKLHKKLMRRRAIRESWPLLVWLGVAALGVWAYKTGGEFNRMRGVVKKPIETVSAPYTGKLIPLREDADAPKNDDGTFKKLEQGIFIEGGKVVAMLDDAELLLEIDAEKQKATFDRAKVTHELNTQVNEGNSLISQLENEQQVLESELRAQEALKEKIARDVKNGLQPLSTLAEVEKDIETLLGDIDGKRKQIEATYTLVEASSASVKDLQGLVNLPDGENAILKLLHAKVANSAIRTTSAGYIDKIYARPGSVIKEGDPIMDIVVKEAKTITALIPEEYSLTMKVGDTAYIAIPNNRKDYVKATVTSLQQSLMQIPDYGSPIRGRMVRGRLVEFGNLDDNSEDSQLPLLPGSEVIVSVKPPGRIPFLSWFNE